jgi:hypothetical protein
VVTDTYLNHITLDTGHTRRAPRDEVAPETLQFIGEHLRRAVATGSDPIPDLPYDLRASASPPFLLGTIMDGSAPILTFGVAPRARGAARLWAMLIEGRGYAAEAAQPPPAPWCAVRFDLPHLLPKISTWAAAYESRVAWAWIEGERDA